MANNIVPFDTPIPAHIAARVNKGSAIADSMAGGIKGGAEYPRISIKGARFRIIEDGAELVLDTNTLEVIIVGANPGLSKAWYATAWNPDAEPSSPDCFTMDGITPDAESAQPQNDVCVSCPQNAWGSKITPQGTKIKACADAKRLAVVAAESPDGPVYLLQVTPAALKGLSQYHKELSMRGIVPEIVRTIVGFDTSASFPKLTFGFGGFISAETQAIVDPLFGSDQVLEATGTPSPVAAAPTGTTPPAAVAATPAETPEPEPEPEPEPVPAAKATGFGKAAPAKAETKPAPAKAETKPAAKATGFGKAAATPAPVEAAPEPAAATVADSDDLASEIAKLMEDVADDGAV